MEKIQGAGIFSDRLNNLIQFGCWHNYCLPAGLFEDKNCQICICELIFVNKTSVSQSQILWNSAPA